jgi:hypothetical protein
MAATIVQLLHTAIQIFIRRGFPPGKGGGYCRRRELHGRDASRPLIQGKNPCL